MESDTISRNSNMASEEECICPICLRTSTEMLIQRSDTIQNQTTVTGSVEFVHSRTCGHIYCLSCIEQILLAPNVTKRTDTMRDLEDDEHVTATTQGACPMCRAELSYFDLMKVIIENDAQKDKGNGQITIIKSNDPIATTALDDVLPSQLRDVKFQSPDNSYIKFSPDMKDLTTQSGTLYTPYFNDFAKDGILQLTGYQYLAKTNTFKAKAKKIVKESDVRVECTVWMNFSDNFQFITHGVCRKVETRQFYEDVDGESYPQHRTEVKTCVYPFGVTKSNHMCRVLRIPRDTPPIPCNGTSCWGNIYCQQNMIGLASYHFIKKPDRDGSGDGALAYICYDHKNTSAWSSLDNGRPLPSRVLFRNITCPDKYTFRGSICWYEDYNTTWHGMSRWDYEIKFDTTFFCIQSGTVHSLTMNHTSENVSSTEVVSKMSTFGVDLDYINAGVCDSIIQAIVKEYLAPSIASGGVDDDPFKHMESLNGILDAICNQIRSRLQEEGVTESTSSRLFDVIKSTAYKTTMTMLEAHRRDPTKALDAIEIVDYPIDLEYYFE